MFNFEYPNSKIYIVKTNSNGQMIWNREIYIGEHNLGNSAIEISDGYLIWCIVIAGTGDEYEDYSGCDGNQCWDTWNAYLIKISNEGDVEWERTFSSFDVSNEYYDWAGETIALTNDGGAIIGVDNGSFSFLKVGNIQNILNNDYKQIRPINFDLESNYPIHSIL